MRRIGMTIFAAIALTFMLGNVALADHIKAICDVRVGASAKLEKGYVLDVYVHSADGRPVNEATVTFYEKAELFGAREMYLGSATTDGEGKASFAYLPATLGTHEIVVRSARKDHFLGAEARTTFDATVAARPYRPAPTPLASFSALLPYAVGVVVLSVWTLLAFALFGTARGVLGGAREKAQGKGDPA